MGKIVVRKRSNGHYQYSFEVAPINGKRKRKYGSGYRTKAEALAAGAEAMVEYNQAGAPYKPCNMSYSDYLDYWLDNYCRKKLTDNTISSYEPILGYILSQGLVVIDLLTSMPKLFKILSMI